jgi:hypothetical protein
MPDKLATDTIGYVPETNEKSEIEQIGYTGIGRRLIQS